MKYLLHLLVQFDIYFIAAVSLNLLVGGCGLYTLAHATFFALGSYTFALALMKLGCTFVTACAFSVSVATVLSLLISLPAWRVRGDFFLLVTLAVNAFFLSLLENWSDTTRPPGTWANLTNGRLGLAGIPESTIAGVPINTPGYAAIVATALAALCGFIAWRLMGSPWGRMITAMRDDELVVAGLGKNIRLAKVQAAAFACGMVAVAGVLGVLLLPYVDPTIASLDHSILMLTVVLIGGSGNFRGPVVGVLVILAIRELLRPELLPDGLDDANLEMLIYGVLLVLMMHWRPQGLAGEYRIQ